MEGVGRRIGDVRPGVERSVEVGRGPGDLVGEVAITEAGGLLLFEFVEVVEGRVELVLKGGGVAAQEIDGAAVDRGGDPAADEGGDFVGALGGFGEGVESVGGFIDLVVEVGGVDEIEAVEGPLEVGELLDEGQGEDGFGAEFVDGGGLEGEEFVGVFDVEDGMFEGGEAVFEGSSGADEFAVFGDWALGFCAVDAGLVGAVAFGEWGEFEVRGDGFG